MSAHYDGHDTEMARALELDAAKIEDEGGDAGITLDDEIFDQDCGLGPDGQCSKAGSEQCDFECNGLAPMRWPL